ncbi:MAG: DoxX family protein [Leptospira sp.]|nr:DoxX family protein [Leptospira sp.]
MILQKSQFVSYMAGMLDFLRYPLCFLVLFFGANGIWHFFPVPPQPAAAESFRNALLETGYMLPFWKGAELIGALLLLSRRSVPLGLLILAPVLLNIFFFHLFLSPKGIPLAFLMIFLSLLIAWKYRQAYKSIFYHQD